MVATTAKAFCYEDGINSVAAESYDVTATAPLRQSFSVRDVTIEVLLAKNFFNGSWVHHGLERIVKQCRKTFYRYGDVASLLDYDTEFAVYLRHVTYTIMEKLFLSGLPFDLSLPLTTYVILRR